MTKRRTKNSKNKALVKFGFFLYIVLSLFTIIWLKAAVVNIKYELGELDKTKAELVRERKLVVAKRANFYSTERIEKVKQKKVFIETYGSTDFHMQRKDTSKSIPYT